MKKRLSALFLALILLLTLCGCGEIADTAAAEQTKTAEPAQSEPAAAPAADEPETTEETAPEQSEEAALPEEDAADDETPAPAEEASASIAEDGSYTSKDDVALYIHTYGHLPGNFITKKQAQALGWSGGSLEPYAPGKCIGGSHFGNYEGILPEKDGRSYTEGDIDTLGADKRGAKRIVFSNDGLIYYTEDHYETFELLYGEEG